MAASSYPATLTGELTPQTSQLGLPTISPFASQASGQRTNERKGMEMMTYTLGRRRRCSPLSSPPVLAGGAGRLLLLRPLLTWSVLIQQEEVEYTRFKLQTAQSTVRVHTRRGPQQPTTLTCSMLCALLWAHHCSSLIYQYVTPRTLRSFTRTLLLVKRGNHCATFMYINIRQHYSTGL